MLGASSLRPQERVELYPVQEWLTSIWLPNRGAMAPYGSPLGLNYDISSWTQISKMCMILETGPKAGRLPSSHPDSKFPLGPEDPRYDSFGPASANAPDAWLTFGGATPGSRLDFIHRKAIPCSHRRWPSPFVLGGYSRTRPNR